LRPTVTIRRLTHPQADDYIMKNIDFLKQHGDVIWNIANLLRGP
jgi:hypothetical protein